MTDGGGRRAWLATVAALAGLGLLLVAAVAFAVTGYGATPPTSDDIPAIATARALETTSAATSTPTPGEGDSIGDERPTALPAQDGNDAVNVDSGERQREVVRPQVRDEEHDDDEEDGESTREKRKKK